MSTFWTQFTTTTSSIIQDNWEFYALMTGLFIGMLGLTGIYKALKILFRK